MTDEVEKNLLVLVIQTIIVTAVSHWTRFCVEIKSYLIMIRFLFVVVVSCFNAHQLTDILKLVS